MFLTIILYLAAAVSLVSGVPILLDPNSIMQQNYGAIHVIGGLLLFGVGFAIQRIENLIEWKKTSIKTAEAKRKRDLDGVKALHEK